MGRRVLHQAIRSKNRRMEALSLEVPRVNLPTVFSANSLMQNAVPCSADGVVVGRPFMGRPVLHQAIRSKNRRMEALSPEVPRVNLPTVFSANSLMQDAAIHGLAASLISLLTVASKFSRCSASHRL